MKTYGVEEINKLLGDYGDSKVTISDFHSLKLSINFIICFIINKKIKIQWKKDIILYILKQHSTSLQITVSQVYHTTASIMCRESK